ncbi:MAG: hypothetical protein KJP21_05480, partial [Bacteroidia bacterium]|nr:hypothetical protein [Bacteroidia bacterium]
MIYRLVFSLWAIIVLTFTCSAQEPLYKLIGHNDVLRGIEIYGITQDLSSNIWLTTSNGIYKYDGLSFTNYKNENLGGNDFFQPTITKNGRLYFATIAGNIYTLINEEIVLFKENDVPNPKEFISLISSHNHLYLISNDSLYQIDSLGKRLCVYGYPNAFIRLQFTNYKSSENISIYTNGLQEKIRISGNFVTVQKNNGTTFENNTTHSESYVLIDGKIRHYTRKINKKVSHYSIDEKGIPSLNVNNDNIAIWYTSSKGEKWIIKGFQQGLDFTRNGAQTSKEIFKEFTINFLFEDKEGDIWIGTKNNGLILISSVNNYLLKTDEPVKGLEVAFESIISFSSNKTYILDPKFNSIKVIPNSNASSNVHLIADRKNKNSYYIQNSGGLQHYKDFTLQKSFKTATSLIKRHHWYKDSFLILSSINGAHQLKPNNSFEHKRIGELFGRCIDAIWIEEFQKYFIGSSKGLASCSKNGSLDRYISFNNTPLDIQLLFYYESYVYAISTSGKIYKINADTYETEYITRIDKNFLVGGVQKDAKIYLIDKQKLVVFSCTNNRLSELPLQLSP